MKRKSYVKSTNISLHVFTILMFLIGSFLTFINTSRTNALIDFTYQLENSYRISVGQIPYKDFFLVLMPGVYYLDAIFLKIFRYSNLGQVFLLLIMYASIFFLTSMILVRIAGKSIVTYLGIAVSSLAESTTYPFVIYNNLCYLLILWAIFYFFKTLNRLTFLKSVALGFFVALPFYAKQNYGAFFLFAFYFFFFFILAV